MIVASNNVGKLKEIREILSEYEISSLKDKNIDIDVVEDSDTFYGNASKKAREIYKLVHEPVIADDSGLCINVLNNFPGVLTHRFLGNNKTDLERNRALLGMLEDKSDRSAKVVCVIVYYDGENEIVSEGILEGNISTIERGNNGFGFDSIFEVNDKTLAEMSCEEKNNISARRIALNNLKLKLRCKKM